MTSRTERLLGVDTKDEAFGLWRGLPRRRDVEPLTQCKTRQTLPPALEPVLFGDGDDRAYAKAREVLCQSLAKGPKICAGEEKRVFKRGAFDRLCTYAAFFEECADGGVDVLSGSPEEKARVASLGSRHWSRLGGGPASWPANAPTDESTIRIACRESPFPCRLHGGLETEEVSALQVV